MKRLKNFLVLHTFDRYRAWRYIRNVTAPVKRAPGVTDEEFQAAIKRVLEPDK